jgi:phage terminase large subunit-like protein
MLQNMSSSIKQHDIGNMCLKQAFDILLDYLIQFEGNEALNIGGTIGDFLRELQKSFRIAEVRYDPFHLYDLSTRLRSEGLRMVEFPQSVPNLTNMGQNLYELIKGQNLVLYPDDFIRICASHVIAVQTSRGWKIAKEKTGYKIDVIVALAMTALSAVEHGGDHGWSRGPLI